MKRTFFIGCLSTTSQADQSHQKYTDQECQTHVSSNLSLQTYHIYTTDEKQPEISVIKYAQFQQCNYKEMLLW